MSDQQDNLRSKFKGQAWTKPERSANWRKPKGAEQKPEHFGLERGNRFVRRFRLFFRNGCSTSIPYAHLPVIIYDPDKDLKIRTGDMEVTIKGRGLDRLSDHLNEEKVLWIKESASQTDTGEGGVFVSGITVDGDLLL